MAVKRSRRSRRAVNVAFSIAAILLFAATARAADYPLAGDDTAIGAVATVPADGSDTLMDIARRYDLGFTQLMAANRGVNPWMPGGGREITLPNLYLLPDAPRSGIVVNLAEQRLYYFRPAQKMVQSYPIGLGVLGADTPIGTTHVVARVANPAWYPPPSIHEERPELPEVIGPGPDNPLGAFALRLGWPTFLIHGTNKPDSVGRDVSHGCMHLYPEDIAELYREVTVGTPVHIVDQAVKVAWIGQDLFVEIHPTKEQGDELDIDQTVTPAPPPADLEARVSEVAGEQVSRVDWDAVQRVALERTGVPTRVTKDDALDRLTVSAKPAETAAEAIAQ